MNHVTVQRTNRRGFTLIELVVVVLILGIIAAVAAPKMFDTAGDARTNSTRQSLVVVRDSIELYRAQNGSYPPAATLATALEPFLRGAFPTCQVGNTNADIFVSAANPIVVGGAGQGWAYNQTTGEFVINHADGIAF
ncbi:MAG: prepilin-type N-terminal cleavage/methylation domain-containing protein [Planctomycetaceae bacterium]|jgi:general secretion pathway protein G|nr:prepilin-type N-terminal cleavage/methylation domain-containing protein [Planctomycetaceae bacterium]MBT6155808.1 prepilin-type N-terminal cleavage/methylation domain-containing protein [Planctomycetaceae bacterium]MBT6484950.1 prepilin-type N-terminal cleavage/methylation domain-containing protein [Planctomycetaceae bacterium]MBT6495429.1 prepilin-type N-terminal cleavage/methylation domain-containing protein [Planctomycetaceae bacterium]